MRTVRQIGDAAHGEDFAINDAGKRAHAIRQRPVDEPGEIRRDRGPDDDAHPCVCRPMMAAATVHGRGDAAFKCRRASVSHSPGTSTMGWSNAAWTVFTAVAAPSLTSGRSSSTFAFCPYLRP